MRAHEPGLPTDRLAVAVTLAPDIPSLIWVVAYQMGLYAVMWALSVWLLRESRDSRIAVAHWVGFMALLCLGLMLAGGRGEPRTWWHYNGTNAVIPSLGAGTLKDSGKQQGFQVGVSHSF